jgi:hypothetical protein
VRGWEVLLILVVEGRLSRLRVQLVSRSIVQTRPGAHPAVCTHRPGLALRVPQILLTIVGPGVHHAIVRDSLLLGGGLLLRCSGDGLLLSGRSLLCRGRGGCRHRLRNSLRRHDRLRRRLLLGLLRLLLSLLGRLGSSLLGLLLGLLCSLLLLLLGPLRSSGRLLLSLLRNLLGLLLRGGLLHHRLLARGGGGRHRLLILRDLGHILGLELSVGGVIRLLPLLAQRHRLLVNNLTTLGMGLANRVLVDMGPVVQSGGGHLNLLLHLLARVLILMALVDGEGLPAILQGVLQSVLHPRTRLLQLRGHRALRHATSLLSAALGDGGEVLGLLLGLHHTALDELEQVGQLHTVSRRGELGEGGGGSGLVIRRHLGIAGERLGMDGKRRSGLVQDDLPAMATLKFQFFPRWARATA